MNNIRGHQVNYIIIDDLEEPKINKNFINRFSDFKKPNNTNFEMEKIPILLRKLRAQKKLTQKQLGEKLGKLQCHIAHFENPKTQVTSDTIEKICEALEVEITFTDVKRK